MIFDQLILALFSRPDSSGITVGKERAMKAFICPH
jgi:hypothetical protein